MKRRSNSLRSTTLLWALSTALVGYGCSLINAPEDLKEAFADNTGGTGQGGSNTGGTGGGDAGSSSTGGSAPVVAPTTGMFVLAAKDETDTRQLVAMSASNGKELARVALPVAAIAYDEAPGRYVWFVFTASKFPADPTRTADLEVRRFDDATKKWTIVSKASGLPPPRPDHLVVLNNRLAYLSYKVVSDVATQALTVLDTSDLTKVKALSTRTAAADTEYVGLVGTRGSDTDKDADGGALDLMIKRNCTADCELYAQSVFVSDDLVDGKGAVIDHFVGTPRFAAARTSTKVYAAMYSTQPATAVEVRSFPSDDPTSSTLFTISQLTSQNISGFDLLECADAGVLRGDADNFLVAFHLTSGKRQTADLNVSGDLVYAEPFQGNAITLSDEMGMGGSGGFDHVRAFQVEKSGSDDLAVNERSLWSPPADLVPLTGATRYPETLDCQ